jgi:hypothetical protein
MREFMLGIALVALVAALARARADSKYWDDEDIGTPELPAFPRASAKPGGPGTPRRR